MDDDGKTRSVCVDGRYENPWEKWKILKGDTNFTEYLKLAAPVTKSITNFGAPKKDELSRLQVITTELDEFKKGSPESGVRHMWIGHSTSLVQFDDITILTDPIFSERSSFSQSYGPKRHRKTPCDIEDLHHVDCVVISHNHYDHLDYNSVTALNKKFGDNLVWYVPKGLWEWMTKTGRCKNVIELDWWESHTQNKQHVEFICTPAQHWSKRNFWDTNKSLWCSWTVRGPKHSFFFTGDTGYCEVFKAIGNNYGPFDLATIPIGAYKPEKILHLHHVDPLHAVMIHEDIQSRNSVGIHWGTFTLSEESYMAPKYELDFLAKVRSVTSFVTVAIGEVKIFKKQEAPKKTPKKTPEKTPNTPNNSLSSSSSSSSSSSGTEGTEGTEDTPPFTLFTSHYLKDRNSEYIEKHKKMKTEPKTPPNITRLKQEALDFTETNETDV